jgi:hypothetical protein
MIVLLKQDVGQTAKDIVRIFIKVIRICLLRFIFKLVWRIHELSEREFEQGRFKRRRYRQQMRELQMPSPYETQPIASYYPPTSYYMCSPPPSYHAIYQTPNTSAENHPVSSPESSSPMPNFCMTSSTPTSYPLYDPYSTSYYATAYHPMTLPYASPNESAQFDD